MRRETDSVQSCRCDDLSSEAWSLLGPTIARRQLSTATEALQADPLDELSPSASTLRREDRHGRASDHQRRVASSASVARSAVDDCET